MPGGIELYNPILPANTIVTCDRAGHIVGHTIRAIRSGVDRPNRNPGRWVLFRREQYGTRPGAKPDPHACRCGQLWLEVRPGKLPSGKFVNELVRIHTADGWWPRQGTPDV